MALAPQIQGLPGYRPGCEPLVRIVDTYYQRLEPLRALASSGWDGQTVAGVVVKISEGGPAYLPRKQSPRVLADAELAHAILAGSLEVARICTAHEKPWGVYHYATPGHDGALHYDDCADEAGCLLAALGMLRSHVRSEGLREPELRLWLDLEDQHTKLNAEALEAWCARWLGMVEDEEGYAPLIYTSERYVRHHLPKRHGLGRYGLVDARYHDNDPNRELTAPELPRGWATRSAWQYSSKYQGGLDVSAARLSEMMI